jgi:two-component system OmpR family response regulator
MSSVLMVEDDAEITELLQQYLPRYGLELFSVVSPAVALNKLEVEQYDLVLLDLSLPEMDGLELCKLIKKRHPALPVIISTARGDVSDKVIGFEVGADDYVAKPYDPRELVARIQSHIKRAHNLNVSEASEFRIDHQKFRIYHKESVLDLTMAEFEIFALLLQNKHKVLSREFIINSVNSIDWESSDHSINVIVGRIRHKINDNVKMPRYIKSVRGVGYQYIGD